MNPNKIPRSLARSLPGGRSAEKMLAYLIDMAVYKPRLRAGGVDASRLLILGTIARSGTHYMMLLLANYLRLLLSSDEAVTPSLMNSMFPNNWHINYLSYHKAPFGPFFDAPLKAGDVDLSAAGLDDVTRSHALFQTVYWRRTKVLHLYRNPLDYSVSLFNYKYKNRENADRSVQSPKDVLEQRFENYSNMYNSYKGAAMSGKYNLLRFSYEALIQDPQFYLDATIRWLGLEPETDLVEIAVRRASIKQTKEAEARGEKVNPTAVGLRGSFISSGQIGQWRDFYTDKELKYWKNRFAEKDIDLDSFVLRPHET